MCPACGNTLWQDQQICPHHVAADPLEAANNRAMCGLIHRKIEPARVKEDWTESWLATE